MAQAMREPPSQPDQLDVALAFPHELSRSDVWLQAAAGSGSGQMAVKSSPTAIPTEISRKR
jgi:hypothetical protein